MAAKYVIALPQLAGAHTGERFGKAINNVILMFRIKSGQVGYFVLANISCNNVAVNILAKHYYFNGNHRSLCCSPHTINPVGRTVIFGIDRKAFRADTRESAEEAELEAK